MNYHDIGDWSDLNCDKTVDRMVAEAEARPGVIVTATCGAWSLSHSRGGVDKLGNVFGARVRRSTSKRDWMILGRMLKRIGAPAEATPKTIETDATATHYWTWGGTVPQEEAKGLIEKARDIFYGAANKNDS